MKNIDHRIAQSEAEWQRYRYEYIGVRESANKLLKAVKRRIAKSINRLFRSVNPGMKRATFQSSYDEKKENIVVTLTTTQSRIKTIFPTLYSLMAQIRKPDLIVLWLGKDIVFPRRIIAKIEKLGITVKFREDVRSHTKYYYAFDEYKNDLVITVDDDIIYHEKMIEELYETSLKYPEHVIGRRVHKMRFAHDKTLVKYLDWIWEYRDCAGPALDLMATGVAGILFPPAVLASECWKSRDFLKVTPGNDDLWFKFSELSQGIRVCAVDNSQYDLDVQTFRTPKTALAADNVGKGRNDIYIQACVAYFGMSDDLCERVYAEE